MELDKLDFRNEIDLAFLEFRREMPGKEFEVDGLAAAVTVDTEMAYRSTLLNGYILGAGLKE